MKYFATLIFSFLFFTALFAEPYITQPTCLLNMDTDNLKEKHDNISDGYRFLINKGYTLILDGDDDFTAIQFRQRKNRIEIYSIESYFSLKNNKAFLQEQFLQTGQAHLKSSC